MEKPHLVILKKVGDTPVIGGCSSCSEVVFDTGPEVGVARVHQGALERLFREHFGKAHVGERARKAAAGTGIQATKD